MLVMRGVIEEKSNRVVEIVVSSVKPFQLMMGKIIGIGLVGLTQFLIWIVICIVGMIVIQTVVFPDIMNPENWEQVQQGTVVADATISTGMESVGQTSDTADLLLRQIPWATLIVMFLIYFVGGYLVYASLFAMIGSAVDNEADTQQLMWPVILPLTFSYIVATTVIANPMGSTAVWFSMIPFTSPIIMLERITMNSFDNIYLELTLSVVLLIGTAFLMIWLAAKTYRVGILMYGKKVSWKELIKWMRY
jgi:ABC-2 type transport system permease protein